MPSSFRPRLALLLLVLPLAACASRPLDVVNPADDSPRLSARAEGVTVTGGGSATSQGWDRRLIVSFSLRNEGKRKLRLEREDLVMRLGPRHVAAHTLVGSEETGPVDALEVPPRGRVDFIAQFSTSLGIRKTGSILLRLGDAGGDGKIELEVPIRLREPPELQREPALMDRAGGPPDLDERGG